MTKMVIRQAIRELAQRPQGVSNRDLQDILGVTTKQADSALTAAKVAGEVCSVHHPDDPKHRQHCFTHPAAAKAWAAGMAPTQYKPRAPQKEKAPQGHAWRPAPIAQMPTAIITAGPSKMASSAPSQPVTGGKLMIGASPVLGIAAKYFVDPATVRGPFSLVGIGRDAETGRAWGSV
jgi:hypothetical protein